MPRTARALAFLGAFGASVGALGQAVSLSGSLGDKALLVIDGSPRTLAVGASSSGVRLVSVNGVDAVVDIKGQRVTLLMGGAPVNLSRTGSAGGDGEGQQIVLTASSGGHFVASGSINGHATRFLVDTGATNVTLSQSEARSLGIDYLAGERGMSQTANGAVPVYYVPLTSVRIGEVTVYGVTATVLPMPMQYVLLGNSFLTRFQMRRDTDVMTLVRQR